MNTALVYHPAYLDHDTGDHPEAAARLEAVMGLLKTAGLLGKLAQLRPEPASHELLAAVHTEAHIRSIQRLDEQGGGWIDGDTVMSPASYEAALLAAGGAVRAVDAVLSGEAGTAFALVRPPGHHATADRSMGFCIFNNVAVAASHALTRHRLERVLIVDFDVHHGNGTQDIFYQESRVLYFSTHQYPFYPGSGLVGERGQGPGKGFTMNVPLPAGCGDDEYLRVFREILEPAARRFQPQLILVSAGFDAHWRDTIGQMQVSVDGFARMGEALKRLASELCQGRLVYTLEGGYDLQALAHSVRATLEVLNDLPVSPDPVGPPPQRHPTNIDTVLEAVRAAHGL
ncbi:MAG: histone deacetylase [Dehalococcoidia bacterium]|nr:histone deacetylase [Dehalococcoidia bacterium]